jgi:hypothetical protein
MRTLLKRLAYCTLTAALTYGVVASGGIEYTAGFRHGLAGEGRLQWRPENEPLREQRHRQGWEAGNAVFRAQVEHEARRLGLTIQYP